MQSTKPCQKEKTEQEGTEQKNDTLNTYRFIFFSMSSAGSADSSMSLSMVWPFSFWKGESHR